MVPVAWKKVTSRILVLVGREGEMQTGQERRRVKPLVKWTELSQSPPSTQILEGKGKGMIYRNTEGLFKERLKKDLGLPSGPLTEALVLAAVEFVQMGPVEAAPLAEKYPDLVCHYHCRLHRSTDCDALDAKIQKEGKAGEKA